MEKILTGVEGDKMLLLGNEAIVRGALEAGVDIAATYPGTPSSEIGNTLYRLAKDAGMYFEFSANEKVAVEVSGAAAAAGLRALCFMKHVGLNVASDAFMTLAYVGVKGGYVLVSADDPSCHSSQNEQDNRYYARLAGVPMLEPVNPQECKDMTRWAYELSEKVELPVMLRTTTRVNHVRGPVEFAGKTPLRGKGHLDRDIERWVTVPSVARKRHPILLKHLGEAQEMAEASPWNTVEEFGEEPKLGIVTSGIAYKYVKETVAKYGLSVKVLRLGFSYPIAEKKMAEFLKTVDNVVAVEEGEPILEGEAARVALAEGLQIKVYGKRTGHMPWPFEYSQDVVADGLSKLLDFQVVREPLKARDLELPSRPPTLCAGCPHRATYYACLKALKGRDTVFTTDIGCYTLGIQPPFNTADYLLCMGSSVGAAGGFSAATDQTIVGFVGDSTFFHASTAGLISSVYNGHKFVYCVVDNRTTAMTGHQPNPGMGVNGMGEPAPMLKIEDIARGIGATFVKTTEPYDLEATTKVFEEALEHDGIAVIVSKHPCALLEIKDKKRAGEFHVWQIDQETCRKCHACIRKFGCPAFFKDDDKTVYINESLCNGCGVCEQVCPFGAIKMREADP